MENNTHEGKKSKKQYRDSNPAFPLMTYVRVGDVDEATVIATGLSKLEVFAGMAMQGLRASKLVHPDTGVLWSSKDIAEQAVWDAASLIEELKREREQAIKAAADRETT